MDRAEEERKACDTSASGAMVETKSFRETKVVPDVTVSSTTSGGLLPDHSYSSCDPKTSTANWKGPCWQWLLNPDGSYATQDTIQNPKKTNTSKTVTSTRKRDKSIKAPQDRRKKKKKLMEGLQRQGDSRTDNKANAQLQSQLNSESNLKMCTNESTSPNEDGRSETEEGNTSNCNDSCDSSYVEDNLSDGNSGHGNSPSEATPAWEEKFKLLVEYKMKHGTTKVARKQNHALYKWTYRQRTRRSQLSSSQQQRLESIGFEWNDEELRKKWMKRYGELVEFHEKHGHTSVPNKWKENPQLGSWVDRQRYCCKVKWRIDLLNDVGFAWSGSQCVGKIQWMKRYEELVQYKEKYGNTCVPKRWKENLQLAHWVKTQRHNCKEQWRIDLLNDIGFVWSSSREEREKWMKRYEELVEYKEKYGNTCVPITWKENPQLHYWVRTQRKQCKEQWRIDLLNDIGFVWSSSREEREKCMMENWMIRYGELVEFKKKHGHTLVPNKWKENPQLGTWVKRQRQQCREQSRVQLLDDIGFAWSNTQHSKITWMKRYKELVEYKEKYGNTLVPYKWKENPQLGTWVYNQRQRCKEQWRIDLLNDIGFALRPERMQRKPSALKVG